MLFSIHRIVSVKTLTVFRFQNFNFAFEVSPQISCYYYSSKRYLLHPQDRHSSRYSAQQQNGLHKRGSIRYDDDDDAVAAAAVVVADICATQSGTSGFCPVDDRPNHEITFPYVELLLIIEKNNLTLKMNVSIVLTLSTSRDDDEASFQTKNFVGCVERRSEM